MIYYFYNLEFIKYKSTKDFHPLLNYMENSKYEDSERNSKEISYIFASYDFALLKSK